MIIDATYEGNGIFKVWPPPGETEIKSILGRILMQDPGNAPLVNLSYPIQYNEVDVDEEDL